MNKNKAKFSDKTAKNNSKSSDSSPSEITNFTAAHINSGVTSADKKLAEKFNEEKKFED